MVFCTFASFLCLFYFVLDRQVGLLISCSIKVKTINYYFSFEIDSLEINE